MKTNVLIGMVAMVALAAGLLLQITLRQQVHEVPVPTELAFSFPDVEGNMQPVSQWRGKILLINFWATWCPPCLKEIPEFIKWQREYAADNVQFIGIALDDKAAVVEYLKDAAVNYPILLAGEEGSLLAHQLGNIIDAVPFTVVVDRAGQIVHRQPGELSREQFLQVVQPLLASSAN